MLLCDWVKAFKSKLKIYTQLILKCEVETTKSKLENKLKNVQVDI